MKDTNREIVGLLCCPIVVVAMLLLMSLLLSCCTARRVATVKTATESISTTVDSVGINIGFETARRWYESVYGTADSVTVVIEADSIVTSDGSRLHRPRIRRDVYSPRHGSVTAGRDSSALTATVAGSHIEADSLGATTATDTQSSATALAKPPNLTAIVIALLLAIIIIAYTYTHKRK